MQTCSSSDIIFIFWGRKQIHPLFHKEKLTAAFQSVHYINILEKTAWNKSRSEWLDLNLGVVFKLIHHL